MSVTSPSLTPVPAKAPRVISPFPENPRWLLLQQCHSVRDLHQVHAHLLKTSLLRRRPRLLENLLESSALLLPNPDLSYALKIFDTSPIPPHTEAYNILIRAFNRSRSPSASFRLFLRLLHHDQQTHPDTHTFSCVLKACSQLRHHSLGRALHARALMSGLESEAFVLNSLIHMYASCGAVESARQLFDKMPDKDVVTWNAMIAGYFKAGDWGQVVELFRGMLELGVEFDEVTLISVLTACARAGELELGEWIGEYVVENGLTGDRNLMTSLVDMYAKCGRVDRAREVFDEMPCRDVVAWSAMVSGYNQWNRCKEALDLFHEMQEAGVAPNEVTMVSVLSSCTALGALETGRWVHSYVKRKGIRVTVNLGTALVNFYAKCGCIEDALDVFRKMPERNSWSWTAMIRGLASNGRGRDALKLFASMVEAELEPNGITFLAVLSACSHTGLVEEGKHYFDSMSRVHGIDPGIEHYGCVVDVLGRAGLLGEAYEFIKTMPIEPNAIIWRTLLSACKIHKNVEIGEESLDQIVQLEPRHSGDYILLSNIYASVGRMEDAINVRNQMKEKGIKKIPGCSLLELDDTIHEFFAEDTEHPDSCKIYEKIEEIVGRIKEAGYVPDLAEARLDAEEDEKEVSVSHHSEKLAIAYGLIRASPGAAIRVSKNLRVCTDCHVATKLISQVYKREIIVRDRNRFHHFKDGSCSCNDYW